MSNINPRKTLSKQERMLKRDWKGPMEYQFQRYKGQIGRRRVPPKGLMKFSNAVPQAITKRVRVECRRRKCGGASTIGRVEYVAIYLENLTSGAIQFTTSRCGGKGVKVGPGIVVLVANRHPCSHISGRIHLRQCLDAILE